jgi:hypothetical protein
VALALRLCRGRKEDTMKVLPYFIPFLFAGALLGSPATALADGEMGVRSLEARAVEDTTNVMTNDESAQQTNAGKLFLVAVDYCYLGSIVDDTTGEILDLYGICDGGENFDVA